MKNTTLCLFVIFSILQSDTYSWDNGGTILGSFGNLGSAMNVDNTLILTEDPIDGTPSGYIAAVSGLNGGESIEVCVDMYTPNSDVKGRIWGHYYDGLDICLLPWINSENAEDVEEFLGICSADIVMCHGEINGAQMQPGHFQGGGTPTDWFKRFEQVYSGHYHHKSELSNIRFLGSQMEFTWNDFGDAKHFHILDTETREIEPVLNPLKMYHKVFYDDTNETLMKIKKKEFSELSNAFVKVIVTNKNEPYWFDVFIEQIIKSGPADLKVVEDHSNLDVLDEDDFATEAEDTLTILTKHIDSLNIEGDKKKLDVLMRSLYTESLDILI